MIQKLRRRFILAAMLALSLVLLLILGSVNFIIFHTSVKNADQILSLLAENQGAFPMHMFVDKGRPWDAPKGIGFDRERRFSPETPYESRFFSVSVDENGEQYLSDVSNIAAVDMDTAGEYAKKVIASNRAQGFVGEYRYLISQREGLTRIIFLDCRREIGNIRITILASFGVAGAALLGVFLLLLLFSGRIVKPVAESYEKQRQFITDAGHEIKTPLTIINADTDLLELECGENEWLQDIRRQAQRLVGLTNDLIYLSRMDETSTNIQYVDFPISDVVEETAQSFLGLSKQSGKRLTILVQPGLSLEGSEKDIRQLTSILLDNAMKYAPENSEIILKLKKDNKSLHLCVENETQQPIAPEKLRHIFDRFYRVEGSHNSATGGYGLGLAIAQGIVNAHRGKLRAEYNETNRLTIIAAFPVGK